MTAVAGAGPRHDRAVAAEQLLAVLYPSPFVVGPGEDAPAVGDLRRTWTAVPSSDRPRLLVPAGHGLGAARSARRQLTGRRLRTRAARAAIGAALATGALARMTRTRVVVTGPEGARSIEDVLCAALEVEQVRVAMPVGPARANRKPVLQVTDVRGSVLAFAKVGHTELTARLVRREAVALRRLAQAPPLGLRVPALLAATDWEGREVLLQEALEVPRHRLTGSEAGERLVRVVSDIARIEGTVTPVPWDQHPLRARLLEQVAGTGEAAEALLVALLGISFRAPVPTGSWHGDLNSGNLALVAGPCPVWDWERYETGVPLGFDLLHHRLHQSITVQGSAPAEAARALVRHAPGLLAPLGIGAHDAEAVARTYLLVLAVRYLTDDQSGAGADLGDVGSWLLPALARPGRATP